LQKSLLVTKPESQIIVQADSVKSNMSVSSIEAGKLITNADDKSFPAKSILDPTDGIGDKDYYIISQQAVEVLY
jgi:hypothetical protein